MKYRVFIILGALPAVLGAVNSWVQQSPSPKPAARWDAGIAAVTDDYAVMVNGFDSADRPIAEIWSYQPGGGSWSLLFDAVTHGITASGGTATVSLGSGGVLAFGGEYSSGAYSDSSWVIGFDGISWSFLRLDGSLHPSARKGAQVARLSEGSILLFGGYNGSYLSDTWRFDTGSGWIQLNPQTSPTARSDAMMAQIGDKKVLLYGGFNGSLKSDTWLFEWRDETDYSWSSLDPAEAPGPAANGDMAYVGDGQSMMKTDLGTHKFSLTETRWSAEVHDMSASAVWDFAMDNVNGKILLFGGFDNSEGILDETWLYESDQSLPVTLLSFIGTSQGGRVDLKWETAAEIENAGFVIRRAAAGISPQEWTLIASYRDKLSLRGRGTTTEAQMYFLC